jgi:hypothetical protein
MARSLSGGIDCRSSSVRKGKRVWTVL